MSVQTGTTISCDRRTCNRTVFSAEVELALAEAEARGWTITLDGRHFCRSCSEIRANRTKLVDLVPQGVRLMLPFDATAAVGWTREDRDPDTVFFYCCGTRVKVYDLLGSPYYAECEKCGEAIADVLGPAFEGAGVRMVDPDRVDCEDPVSWYVVSEYKRIKEGETT